MNSTLVLLVHNPYKPVGLLFFKGSLERATYLRFICSVSYNHIQ